MVLAGAVLLVVPVLLVALVLLVLLVLQVPLIQLLLLVVVLALLLLEVLVLALALLQLLFRLLLFLLLLLLLLRLVQKLEVIPFFYFYLVHVLVHVLVLLLVLLLVAALPLLLLEALQFVQCDLSAARPADLAPGRAGGLRNWTTPSRDLSMPIAARREASSKYGIIDKCKSFRIMGPLFRLSAFLGAFSAFRSTHIKPKSFEISLISAILFQIHVIAPKIRGQTRICFEALQGSRRRHSTSGRTLQINLFPDLQQKK